MNNIVFKFNDNPITFDSAGAIMINATEMAKPFNKRTADWLNNQSSKDFIHAYSEVKNIVSADLVKVIKGGNGEQGTWMHEDIALEFARWLSTSFALWCNDRIMELMKVGMTATSATLEEMANNPDLVIEYATRLKELRAKNAEL